MRKALCAILLLILALSAPAAADVLDLPGSLRQIGAEAFYGDASLSEAILPSGLLRIEERAFAYSALKRVNLPESIEFIADDAFLGCELEYVRADNEYCREWCRSHGIEADSPDPDEGELSPDF